MSEWYVFFIFTSHNFKVMHNQLSKIFRQQMSFMNLEELWRKPIFIDYMWRCFDKEICGKSSYSRENIWKLPWKVWALFSVTQEPGKGDLIQWSFLLIIQADRFIVFLNSAWFHKCICLRKVKDLLLLIEMQ